MDGDKFLVILFIFIFFAIGIGNCTGCGENYSEGSRVGTVYKFSRKGLLVKSWEGEMNLGGVRPSENGAVANTWSFTVLRNSLNPTIDAALSTGKPIGVKYREWLWSPISMGSGYEVIEVFEPK